MLLLLFGRRDLFLSPRIRRALLALSITVVGTSHHRAISATTVTSTVGTIFDSSGYDRHERARCKVAVLYSGHVRSFVQPGVHGTHIENLIEPLEGECDVDVFMYFAVEDQVSFRRGMGKFADKLTFEPYTPKEAAIHEAVQLLKPVDIVLHQEQAGFIPSLCETPGCHANTFGQLYKMKAVYKMMEKHETETSTRYTWIIRSRPDIGWMSPMPPLSRFPPTRVYAGHNFFPLADQFLLIPRRFAEAVFGAVRLCYCCDVLRMLSESGIPAQTETLLRRTLRREGIPFGFFEFPIVIVRHKEGGVCSSLHPHKITCEMLHGARLLDGQACAATVYDWYRRACAEMFPPLDTLSASPQLDILPRRESDRISSDTGNHDSSGGIRLGTVGDLANGVAKSDTSSISMPPFEKATARLEDVCRALRNLGSSIKVNPNPRQDLNSFFVAHHYPFHEVNGGSLDEISVIAGFALSESLFNRLAVSFACLLDNAGRESDTPSWDRRGERPQQWTTTLVLDITEPERRQKATVNCSLVDSMQDISLVLLNHEFEPSETICRGHSRPCLNRVLQHDPDFAAGTTNSLSYTQENYSR